MATPAKFVGWRHHYEGDGASFFPRRWRWQAATRWRQRWFLRPDGDSGGFSDSTTATVVSNSMATATPPCLRRPSQWQRC
ncbi:hypothetical protein M6B38_295170 [Iris pallida]|uniref:Uncharacterized protein n=1 Tax=Iris pallida TaxID=29817 RepID=A0AAX6HSC1_IRIPA|nr:hypothetical protein M6B38_295170 [Iris pallida]